MKTTVNKCMAVLVATAGLSLHAEDQLPAPPVRDNLKSGLVLYFDFDDPLKGGQVKDQSGRKNNGQAVGVKWNADGHRGGCAEFAPTNSYISFANSPALNPPQFTLSAWIKTTYTDGVWRRIFDKGWDKAYALSMCGDFPKGDSHRRGQFSLELGAGGDSISVTRHRWLPPLTNQLTLSAADLAGWYVIHFIRLTSSAGFPARSPQRVLSHGWQYQSWE